MAPSEYLGKLEKGNNANPPISSEKLDGYLASHLIDPAMLRADAFEAFMDDRQKRLLGLIEQAMGKAAYKGDVPEEGEDVESDDNTAEAEQTIPLA